MAAPRDYFVCVFPDDTITGREQHEFVWKVQAFDVEPTPRSDISIMWQARA